MSLSVSNCEDGEVELNYLICHPAESNRGKAETTAVPPIILFVQMIYITLPRTTDSFFDPYHFPCHSSSPTSLDDRF
jgi:hypothetical protein